MLSFPRLNYKKMREGLCWHMNVNLQCCICISSANQDPVRYVQSGGGCSTEPASVLNSPSILLRLLSSSDA